MSRTVAAVLGTLRAIGLDRILGPAGNRPRDLVIAMIVARLIAPASTPLRSGTAGRVRQACRVRWNCAADELSPSAQVASRPR
jgi:hypothetical protein